jgi:hypothetical protein
MPLRNVILRVMLWFLALSAITGVAAVFIQHGNFMWRILGTELCAAFACALFLPCITMIDQERTRASGMLGMVGTVLVFILVLALIWELPSMLLGVSWEDEVAGTTLVLGFAVLISMRLLTLTHQVAHAVTAWTGITVVILAASAFLVAIWSPHRLTSENWAKTAASLTTTGALAAICLLGLGNAPRRRWRWCGVAAAPIAGALWLHEIWIGSGSDLGFAIFAGLLALSAVVGYAIVVGFCTLRPTQSWFRTATIATAVATAALIELYIIQDRGLIRSLEEFWIGRWAAAFGIVTACGTLSLAVLERMNRRVNVDPGSVSITEITVVCPRCRKKQSLPIGDAVCLACNLRISTRVEEPRCATCDYLLFKLTSDRCPECGTPIETSV